jgi:hypothetical protein
LNRDILTLPINTMRQMPLQIRKKNSFRWNEWENLWYWCECVGYCKKWKRPTPFRLLSVE